MDFAIETEGVRRLQTALMTGEALMLFTLAFLRKSGRDKSQMIFWVFLVAAGILMAVSGHRIAILRLLGVTWLYFWLCSEGKRSQYLAISICFCLTSLILLYLTAPFLPLAAQRMLAILPGVDIDPIAKLSADSTSEWRLTLWLDAIKQIPEYLFIGKGFTFQGNFRELLAMAGGDEYVRMWALENSAYHNGILSLLICTGLPGLLLGTGFLVCGLLRYHRLASTFKRNPSLHALWAALFSSVLVTVILYFTVYGDVFVSFPSILFYFSLLEGLYFTFVSSGKTDSLDPAPSSPVDNRSHLASTKP
jgi:O-antigen ligase